MGSNKSKWGAVMVELLISLVSGAVGGNVAGGLLKNFNLGTVGNSVAGIVGGGLGGQVLGMLGAGAAAADPMAGAGMDIGSILANVASGGVGGGVLLAVIGVVRKVIGR